MFPQTLQQELYPLEWDPQPATKNNETEVEEKNQQHTQGIDCTRDEGNMSNANGSPSPRAAGLSSSIVPVAAGAEGSLSREMANG